MSNENMQEKMTQTKEEPEGLNQFEPRQNRNADEELKKWQIKLSEKTAGVSFLPNESRCCKTKFDDLKPIMLREMKVLKIHKGRYLVCKCISKPLPILGLTTSSTNDETYLKTGVNILIQDLNGDVEKVSIYNFLFHFNNIDWIFSETILVIKEPWLRYDSQSIIPSLIIDSPSDIIFVDIADNEFLNKIGAAKWFEEMSKDAEVWHLKANECFNEKKFEKSIFLYDRAIRCNPEIAVLYLYKASSCLRINAFYMAYENAELALEKSGDRENALLRMGKASYGMRQWKKAANYFASVLKEFRTNAEAPKELKRATARLAEQEHGKYDFNGIFIESKRENPQFDIADYSKPIEIANIPGKGRGIISSKDIQKGTLLTVSKSFSSGYSNDFDADLFDASFNSGAIAHMQHELNTMQNLQKNPQISKEFYDLWCGDDARQNKEIPSGIIDAARIQRICVLNRFGSGEEGDKNGISDCHLFILPSYFNHACLANAYRIDYGNVMIVFATDDIKKGDEICISYINPLSNYLERKKELSGWGFICQCELCEMDVKDPMYSERNEMWEEFKKFSTEFLPKEIIAKGEALLRKIRKSYINGNKYKVVLAELLWILSSAYIQTGNTTTSVQYLEEVIKIMDNPLKYHYKIAEICVSLAIYYESTGNLQKSVQMIEKAMDSKFCNDKSQFKLYFPEISHLL